MSAGLQLSETMLPQNTPDAVHSAVNSGSGNALLPCNLSWSTTLQEEACDSGVER